MTLPAGWPEKSTGTCMCDCLQCKTNSCKYCELGKDSKGRMRDGEMCTEWSCCDITRNETIEACEKSLEAGKATPRISKSEWAYKLNHLGLPLGDAYNFMDELVAKLPAQQLQPLDELLHVIYSCVNLNGSFDEDKFKKEYAKFGTSPTLKETNET